MQNHQLLIPKDDRPIRENQNLMQKRKHRNNNKDKAYIENLLPNLSILNIHPETILTVDGRTFNWKNNKRFSRVVQQKGGTSDENTHIGNTNTDGVHTIGDLGYFPTTMNLLEHCPNDKNRLCLNMLEDRVPGWLNHSFLLLFFLV